MRVLVYSIFYKPEPVGTATYTAEMCEWLVARGHQVRVVCPPPYYPHWKIQPGYSSLEYRTETIGGVRVTRCPIYVPAEPKAWKRMLYGVSFAAASFPVMLRMVFWRPALVCVIEPSFLNAFGGLVTAKLSGAVSWLHIQDFEFDIALNMGMSQSGAVGRLAFTLESAVMRGFYALSTISVRMMDHLRRKRVAPERCHMFRNWVDTAVIFPMELSPMRATLGIGADKVVCLFSGSMGAKQGVEIIVEAAKILAHRQDVEFVICGEGGAASDLKAMAAAMTNVRFLPLQPMAALNHLLNVADIHLLPQKPSAQDLVMPSKLLGMAASGRPVIATVNPGTEVAETLIGFGLVTPPGNAELLVLAIQRLADHPDERHRLGRAARMYAVEKLSKEKILGQFEEVAIKLATLHLGRAS